jgi:tRNA(His) 5'-end guanylyltransferase
MPVNDDLGKRMKEFYEQIPKTRLMRRTPVAIRIDGKAFHTFTRGFKKPFDKVLIKSMQETTKYLCENIQGCVLGYTQSDEITLILVDYKELNSSAWFDYEVQKMCSIVASMATMKFNKVFSVLVQGWVYDYYEEWNHTEEDDKYKDTLMKAIDRGAMFDARVFNIP